MKTRSGRILTKNPEISRKDRLARRQRVRNRMNAAEARRIEINDELREQAQRIPLPEESDDEDNQQNRPQQRKPRKMSEYLNKIEKLKLDGNISENWRRFKRYFDIFMRAGELTEKSNEIKINTFLNAVGEEAIEVFDTLELTEDQRQDYDAVIQAFENFCKPKKNTVYERFMFYQRKQKDGEPFDTFLMDIKRLARTCEFTDREQEMLRDQIVMGINDKKVQLRLLETSDLTYAKAVEKGRQGEATKEQIDTMNSKAAEVNEIRKSNTQSHAASNNGYSNNNNNKRHGNSSQKKTYTQTRRGDTQQKSNKSVNENKSEQTICKYCNFCHKFGTKFCPAFGKKCNMCSKANHFASVCKMKNVSTLSVYDDSSYDFDDNEEFMIATLHRNGSRTDDAYSYPWIENIAVNNSSVSSKVDTGAGVDVMPMSVLKKIAPNAKIERTAITLRAFAGEKIRPIGTCLLPCSFRKMNLLVKFAIVDFDCNRCSNMHSFQNSAAIELTGFQKLKTNMTRCE